MNRIPWPSHLQSEYSKALVRLTTFMLDRKQYLLFACVELFPKEVPSPPEQIESVIKMIRGGRVVSNVAVMSVAEGLAWYESALSDALVVPKLGKAVRVTTVALAPEPALGRLVVAQNLPFECRWHCKPSLHHLVPMEEAAEELAWLQPDSTEPARAELREWLAQTIGFDLLARDEFLFGLVLLVPNPVLRGFTTFIRERLPDGAEQIGVWVQPRRGQTCEDVRIRFTEVRPEGISTVLEKSLDALGACDVDLPEQCSVASLEIVSDRFGLLGTDEPHRFSRGVRVDSEVLTSAGSMHVPARSGGGPGGSYPLHARDHKLALRRKARPSSVEYRLLELQSRRETRSREGQPDGYRRSYGGEERIFTGNRDEAVTFIRGAVSRAVDRVIWVDPYFNYIDLREFAFATQYVEVTVEALIGRKLLWETEDVGMGQSKLGGDVFAQDLRALAQTLAASGHRVPDVRLMGGQLVRRYHDRFLVVDRDVWHFGHSFNQVGEAAVSMATRLRYPDPMRTMIVEDVERAEAFLSNWQSMKDQRVIPKQTRWQRVCMWISKTAARMGTPTEATGSGESAS